MARIHRRTIQKRSIDLDNHNGVITNLEPDILEFKVKWALGSITTNKASGSDGIPPELLQILQDHAVQRKCCTQYVSKFGKHIMTTGLKKSIFIFIPKKGNTKECSNYHIIGLISHASKIMLKILQDRLQQYVN